VDSTRSDQSVMLRSPFNGEVITMTFLPGVPPTLDTMLRAGFVQVDAPKSKPRQKEMSHGTSEADGH
jgi:hypothetical protein